MNKHYEDAIPLWITLAKQGDVDAQYNLGIMYCNGLGVLKDIVVAYAWWNVAAAQGNEVARIDRDNLEEDMTPSQLEKAQELSQVYYMKYVK